MVRPGGGDQPRNGRGQGKRGRDRNRIPIGHSENSWRAEEDPDTVLYAKELYIIEVMNSGRRV